MFFPPECFFNVCLPGIENAAVFLFQGQVNVLQALFFCMAVAVNVVFGVFADKDKFVVFSFQVDAYAQKIAGNIVAVQIVFYFCGIGLCLACFAGFWLRKNISVL